MPPENDGVQLEITEAHIDLLTPEFQLRFKSGEAFHRFLCFVEAARIVGDEQTRPIQSELSEEWYALSMGHGQIAIHYFSPGDVDMIFLISEGRWRELGRVVMDSTGEV